MKLELKKDNSLFLLLVVMNLYGLSSCSYLINLNTRTDCAGSLDRSDCAALSEEEGNDKDPLVRAVSSNLIDGASYNTPQSFSLDTYVTDGKIYYTTDGSIPTVNSSLYTDPIMITSDTVIKAIVVGADGTVSDVATYTITIDTNSPLAGTITAPSQITDSGFTLSWSAANDDHAALGLYYYVCTGSNAAAIDTVGKCLASTAVMPYTKNVTSVTIKDKAPSSTYYYNIVVKDAAGNTDIYPGISQTTNADATPPVVGTSSTAAVTATGVTLNWSAASDNGTPTAGLEYFICSSTVSAAAIDTVAECLGATQEMAYTANVTSYPITNKNPNTSYYFNIVVKDASGLASAYGVISQTTANDVTAPTAGGLTAPSAVSDIGMILNWTAGVDDITTAANLQYYVCSSTVSAAAIATVGGCLAATQEMNWTSNVLTRIIIGKNPNTTYYFNVLVRDTTNNKTIYSGITQQTNAASPKCLNENWIPVAEYADAEIISSVPAFCIMKYEAKNDGANNVLSQAASYPWVNITRTDAISRCQALGTGFDLISNEQWQSVARQIENATDENNPSLYLNWQNSSIDASHAINQGNTTLGYSLEANTDDSLGCSGVTSPADCSSGWDISKRTHHLSNDRIIWDLVGNVSEWVKDNSSFNYGSAAYWYQLGGTSGNACLSSSGCSGPQGFPKVVFGPLGDFSLNSTSPYAGLGRAVINYTNGAIRRGGGYNDGVAAGIFMVDLSVASSSTSFDSGFRCVSTPKNPPVLEDISGTHAFTKDLPAADLGFVNTGYDVVSCSVSPALPAGLSLSVDTDVSPASCKISGTPTAPKASRTYTITAQALDGSEAKATVTFGVTSAEADVTCGSITLPKYIRIDVGNAFPNYEGCTECDQMCNTLHQSSMTLAHDETDVCFWYPIDFPEGIPAGDMVGGRPNVFYLQVSGNTVSVVLSYSDQIISRSHLWSSSSVPSLPHSGAVNIPYTFQSHNPCNSLGAANIYLDQP